MVYTFIGETFNILQSINTIHSQEAKGLDIS